jgi:hypothetical protein
LYMTLKIDWKISTILLFGFANLIFAWQGDYEGGDIANARRSYLGSEPIDLWGAWSAFFYGNLPDAFLPWGAWLFLFQISCTTLGLILIIKVLQIRRQFPLKTYLILTYFIIAFSSYLTRDSTMACLFVLGLGVLFQANHRQKVQKLLFRILGLTLIVLALSFRPWLAPVILLIYYYFFEIKLKTGALVLFLLVSPVAIDLLAYQSTSFNKIHPELQVMVMDTASMACISTNEATRLNGTTILNALNKSNFTNSQLCAEYRLNSWQSVASFKASISQMGIKEDVTQLESTSIIEISTELNSSEYTKFREDWLYLIFNHPKDYAQIKFIQLGQTFISGDVSTFRISGSNGINQVMSGIYYLPYDLAIILHLLSPLATLIFGSCFLLYRLKNYPLYILLGNKQVIASYIYLITWSLTTTLAFIGDSGRFTYLSSYVFFILIFSASRKSIANELNTRSKSDY